MYEEGLKIMLFLSVKIAEKNKYSSFYNGNED